MNTNLLEAVTPPPTISFKPVKLTEIGFHYGCIVRDGFQGGTSGAIYCIYQMGDDYDYNIS